MRQYNSRKYGSTASSGRVRRALRTTGLACITFIMGYLYASFYDYKKLNVWMSAHVFGTSARPILPAVTLTANIPKPKFEFYTLLTKDSSTGASTVHAPVTSSTSSAPSTSSQPMSLTVTPASAGTTAHAVLPVPLMAETIAHSAPVLANKETYLVQLASFRAR